MTVRVTDSGMANIRRTWIAEGRTRIAEVERALSSGLQMNQPSDNPTATASLLRHEVRLQRIDQYQRNGDNARIWIGTADQALQSAANNLGRAKTLAVQAGNGIMGSVERSALASDIRSIADGLLTIGNTKVSGRAIFAGTEDTPQAYDTNGLYLGDNGAVERTIDSNEVVAVGATGPEVFGTSDPGDPMNGSVFEALQALADAVDIGDLVEVRVGIEAVDVAMARVGSAQGRVGAVSQQLDAAGHRHGGETLAVQANVSQIRDTDMAEAIIRLRSAEGSYEATLAATARGLSRSLIDFLR
ncbi:MAG: flagellar hook-associated protein 3 [Actinomycetia bacterium]|nr:flagellar hook-associated protein 3 [Actinomycetes bacterium]MCP4227275.1 flagellar hook-associated protein 3 [Actinomycetes bacterium]MCP5035313.1 flagellar hook-associated protein 3 [Actinomycetes bacterium]